MPRIDNDIKLDFKDVLLRPKRSTLKSRADVSFYIIYVLKFHLKSPYFAFLKGNLITSDYHILNLSLFQYIT